jgi:very-short-patch-repair endonuclease
MTRLIRLDHDPAGRPDHEAALLGQVLAAGLPRPERQVRFLAGRRWAFDFAWPDRRVAVEVEGGIWSAGRHVRGDGFERDAIKYSEAAIAGWLVVRVTPAMVADGRALALVERALRARS